MITLKIGGVPEYFNYPIIRGIDQGIFQNIGIDLQWVDVKQGTGKMAEDLQQGHLDLAVILTEGIIKSIKDGSSATLLHTYVESPLQWGIYVPANSDIKHVMDIKSPTFAISRMGSGSHLMGLLFSKKNGWDSTIINFRVVHELNGAVAALTNGDANIFLWERYTTEFKVDDGTFRLLDIFPTPWPCFQLAASDMSIKKYGNFISQTFLNGLLESVKSSLGSTEFKREIADRYNLPYELVNMLYPVTKWNTQLKTLSIQAVKQVTDLLTSL